MTNSDDWSLSHIIYCHVKSSKGCADVFNDKIKVIRRIVGGCNEVK